MKKINDIIISPNSPASNNVGWVKTEEDKLTLKFLINGKWKDINGNSGEGGSTYKLPEATQDTLGGVKLGTTISNEYTPLIDIDASQGDGVGIAIDSSVLVNSNIGLKIHHNNSLTIKYNNGLSVNLGTTPGSNLTSGLIIPCVVGSGVALDDSRWDMPSVGILYNEKQFCLKANGLNLVDGIGSGGIKVTWDANSNMNDYVEPGIYDIYGERTVKTDNLPITNDGSGHSIAARLTVIASTLQPNNTEKCITQFLQLSNRMGGEGNTYIRTYNENNNGLNGWSFWRKLQGIVETYINTDTDSLHSSGFNIGTALNPDPNGLNDFIDNGMYSGIYTDDLYLQAPTFVETFVLIVINDYAVSGQAGTPRRISQLKYAIDTLTGQCTVKKRVGTGNDSISWSDWEEIGGGSSEVDITDAVKAYGLPTLISQGFAKEGVTYTMYLYHNNLTDENPVSLDINNKIISHLKSKSEGSASNYYLSLKLIKDTIKRTIFELTAYEIAGGGSGKCYRYIIGNDLNQVRVSVDMAEL